MIKENNEEGLTIGEQIVKQLGNPKRAKTLHALNKRIEICEKLIRDWEGKLTAKDFDVIEAYKKEVAIQENSLTTEVKVMQLKNIRLPPKQYAKERMELLDKHQQRHKSILKGTYKENISESNFVSNSVTMDNLLKDISTENTPIKKDILSDEELVFTPTRNNKPIQLPPLLSINGVSFLTQENICVLVATRGYGKSNICESILANVINKDCDSLGFEVGEVVKTALYIDNERSEFDVYEGFERLHRRANTIDLNDEDFEEVNKKIGFKALKKLGAIHKRKAQTEKLVREYKPQLLILDTAKSFVSSIIDEKDCREFVAWCVELCWKNNLSILTTLHPNKNKKEGEQETIGGGWLGRLLEEECEGVLKVTMNIDEVRTITSTKNRNSGQQQTSFKYCEELEMMIQCDVPKKVERVYLKDVIKDEALTKLKEAIGYDMLKYSIFLNKVQTYIQQQHKTLPNGTNIIGAFVKHLIEVGEVSKIGATPKTTYNFNK